MKITLIVISALLIGFLIRLIIFRQESQKMVVKLGVTTESKLNSCRDLMNCVSSFESTDPELQKLKTDVNPIAKIKESAEKKGLKIIESNETYLYFNHQSKLFGFVDDVEFLYLPESQELHFRSASRVGKSDLGANKKRVLEFLSELN